MLNLSDIPPVTPSPNPKASLIVSIAPCNSLSFSTLNAASASTASLICFLTDPSTLTSPSNLSRTVLLAASAALALVTSSAIALALACSAASALLFSSKIACLFACSAASALAFSSSNLANNPLAGFAPCPSSSPGTASVPTIFLMLST